MNVNTTRSCCWLYACFIISVYAQLDNCQFQQLKCFSPVSNPVSYHWACCLPSTQSGQSRCPGNTKALTLDAFDRYCPGDKHYRSLCTPRANSECKRGQLSQFKPLPNTQVLPSCNMNQLQCFGHFAAGMYGCCASGTHSHSACPPGTQALTDKDFIDPQTKQSILSSDLKISDFAGVLCDPSENAAVASSQYTICRPTTEWKCDKKKVHSGDRKALSQLTAALAHPNMLSLVACKTRKLECWSNQWSQFAADIRHPHWACCTDAGSACTQHTQLQSAKKLMSSLPSFGLLNGRLCDRGGSVCIAKHNSDCSEALQSSSIQSAQTKKSVSIPRWPLFRTRGAIATAHCRL